MGMRNKERRAAKARARTKQRRRQRFQYDFVGSPLPPLDATGARSILLGAAEARAGNQPRPAAPDAAEALLADVAPEVLDAGVLGALESWLPVLWRGGWLPRDVIEVTRRNCTELAVALMLDVLAADALRYASAEVHPRWVESLRATGATVWWQPGRLRLAQFADRHRVTGPALVPMVIELLAALMSLPALPELVPPPGRRGGPADPAWAAGVDQRVLARVRNLLAKAEATEFPEEAEALSAKAQELMTRYALERAVLDAGTSDRGAGPIACRLWLDPPYVGAKSMLANAVAAANRCRTVLSEKLGFVTVLGHQSDLETVELLTTSLLVQAARAMLAFGRSTPAGGHSRSAAFRQSFLLAYAGRIGERLQAATDSVVAASADLGGNLLPVLAAREEAVEALLGQIFPNLGQRQLAMASPAGYHAGRAAADLAGLDIRRPIPA